MLHRPFLVFVLLLVDPASQACTFFKVTVNGYTMVGNNEDAWSIDPRIWFENGHNGEYGAVYLGQNNSTPQGGMNEAGLMFDGLRSPVKSFAHVPGKPPLRFDDLARRVLRSCSNVHEAEVPDPHLRLQPTQRRLSFVVDRIGEYLVVEADTFSQVMIRRMRSPTSAFRPARTSIPFQASATSAVVRCLPLAQIRRWNTVLPLLMECMPVGRNSVRARSIPTSLTHSADWSTSTSTTTIPFAAPST
ncbi:MAG: hypothetical protein IPN38_19760 [Flavobacteriales bacterium]|nr:hypothetical protein [Flavobacteriales bacterium]